MSPNAIAVAEETRASLRELLEKDQWVGADAYRKSMGKCPPGWDLNPNTNKCQQHVSGDQKVRLGKDGLDTDKAAQDKDVKEPSKLAPSTENTFPDFAVTHETTTLPVKGKPHLPDPFKDVDEYGISKSSRVGVEGRSTAPPPYVPRLPNLTADEREAETAFANAFEADPNGVAHEYYRIATSGKYPIFATDDAKLLSGVYNLEGASDEEKKAARAQYTLAVHPVANAIAKRAFLSKLDELAALPEGHPKKGVLVTSGGVCSGKSSAIQGSPEALKIQNMVGAIWDASGEQYATENPWIMDECKRRGLRPTFLFIDAEPQGRWESALERAKTDGRMVDARLHAESYDLGAKNFKKFYDKNQNSADFVFLSGRHGPKPRVLDEFPEEALKTDSKKLLPELLKMLKEKSREVVPHALRGGSIGTRIWKESDLSGRQG